MDQIPEEVRTTNTEEHMKKKMMAEKSRGHRWPFLPFQVEVQAKDGHLVCLAHTGLSTLNTLQREALCSSWKGPAPKDFTLGGTY